MNAIECGLILNRLSAALGGREVPEEAVQVWTDLLGGADPLVVSEACDLYVLDETNSFFPSVGQVRPFIAQVLRENAVEAQRIASQAGHGAREDCEFCGGDGWGDVEATREATADGEIVSYPAVRPCHGCNPIAYDRWVEHCREVKGGFHRKTAPRREFDFDVKARQAEARAALNST